MSSSRFSQPFVYCSVCHLRNSTHDPLSLTSCAHILCSKHLNSRHICPVCNNGDFSIIKLEEGKILPNDVQLFFQPVPNILESIYNVSVFQMTSLNNQIKYYQTHCVKLREKVARQQQLLYQAKQELDAIPQLKRRIQDLENILQKGNKNLTGILSRSSNDSVNGYEGFFNKNRNGSFSLGRTSDGQFNDLTNGKNGPPPTVDLTLDEDFDEQRQFVTKLKKSSSIRNGNINGNKMKKFIPGRSMTTDGIRRDKKQEERKRVPENNQNTCNASAIAESTHLNKYIYAESNSGNNGKKAQNNNLFSTSSPNDSIMSPILSNNLRSSSDNPYLATPPSLNEERKDNYLPYENIHGNNREKESNINRMQKIQFPSPLEKLKIIKTKNKANDGYVSNNCNNHNINLQQGRKQQQLDLPFAKRSLTATQLLSSRSQNVSKRNLTSTNNIRSKSASKFRRIK